MNKFIVAFAAVGALAFAASTQAHNNHNRGGGHAGRDAFIGAVVGTVVGGIIIEGQRRNPDVIYAPPPRQVMECFVVPAYDHYGRPVYVERCYPAR